MKTRPILILMIVALGILAIPVLAYIPAGGTFYYGGGVSTNQTNSWFDGGSDNGIYGIYFRSAAAIPSLGAVKFYSVKGGEGWGAQQHPVNTTDNSSSLSASLRYSGTVVSTGTLYYSLSDVTGDIYIAYFVNTWNPANIPDNSVLYLEYDRTKFNWRFSNMGRASNSEWQGNLISAGFTFTGPDADPANIYMPYTSLGAYGHYVDYTDTWKLQYSTEQKTDFSSYLDLIRNVDGVLYNSRVMVNETYNGVNTTIYDEWNVIDTRISNINHDRDIYITAWDPKLRRYSATFNLSSTYAPINPYNIDLGVNDNSINLGDTVTGTLSLGSFDSADAGWIHYSQDVLYSGTPVEEQIASYKNISGNWNRLNFTSYAYNIPVTFVQALNVSTQINDAGTRYVRAKVYDLSAMLVGTDTEYIEVAPEHIATITLVSRNSHTGSLVSNVNLEIYDITENLLVIDTLDADGTYQFHGNGGFAYNVTASASGYYPFNYAWIQPYGSIIANLNLIPFTGIQAGNASWTFKTYKNAISGGVLPNVVIRLSDGQQLLTNVYGTAVTEVLGNTQYSYTASLSGYESVTGNVTTVADTTFSTIVIMKVPTVSPIPTIPTRPCDDQVYYKLHVAECRDVYGEGAIDIFFNNIETISSLIVMAIILGLVFMMVPGGKRR